MDPNLRRRPLVFVDDLDRCAVSADDLHHLSRSLRLPPGAPITVGDGAGSWRVACMAVDGVEADGETHHQPAPLGKSAVAFAPVKGNRTEWVVQKLTELDVAEIVIVHTERSVVRWEPARSAKKMDKLAVVAREAAMQSRRLWLPTIGGPLTIAELRHDPARRWLLAEPGAPSLVAAGDSGVVIGPEGGFTAGELAGAATVGLPGNILRAETAAVAAATLLAVPRR